MGGSSQAPEAALLFEKQAGIATLTLNRPAVLNALTTGMFQDMERYLLEIEADDQVRVVVIRASGRGFSAGADLKPASKDERRRTHASGFPGDAGGDILERGNRCILRLRQLPKPVLGSINGDAVVRGEFIRAVSANTPHRQQLTAAGELLNAIVVMIGNIDVAVPIEGDP